jgi:hypothetical protein
MSQIKRKYEVHEAPDDPKTGSKRVDVFFPKGHSNRFTVAEAARLGFTRRAPLVHMQLGEEIPEEKEAASLRNASMQLVAKNARPGSGDLEDEAPEITEQE